MDSVSRLTGSPAGVRIAGAICVGVVAIAPLAVGGFRPQWWLLFAGVIFAAAALCTLSAAASGRRLRFLSAAAPGVAPIYVLFLAGLCVHLLFIGGAASDTDAMYGLLRQLSYAALVWTLLQSLTRDRRASHYAAVLLFAFMGYAVYGLVTIDRTEWLLFDRTAYLGYATGPFVNRNSFATFMAMGMSLALASAMADERGIGRRYRRGHRSSVLETRMRSALLALVALLCLAAVLASASRMGLFVAVVGAIIVVALRLRRGLDHGGSTRLVVTSLALLIASALCAVALLYGGDVTERLGSTADSASVRLDLYRNILDMIALNPLTGVGLDNFGEAFRAQQELPVSPDLSWRLAHNTYLALWSELGIVLGSIPVLLGVLVAGALLRRSLSHTVTPVSHLSDAALAALVLTAIHALVDFSLEMPANTYLLLTLIALGLAPLGPDQSQAKGK